MNLNSKTPSTGAGFEDVRAPAVFVHLCSGDVVSVSPATRVCVGADSITLYDGSEPVATYSRREVYLCSKTETSPVLS